MDTDCWVDLQELIRRLAITAIYRALFMASETLMFQFFLLLQSLNGSINTANIIPKTANG
jgi:hypothetical protein